MADLKKSLEASARDVVLAALAAFAGSLALALEAEASAPALKAGVVAALYAAARAGVGAIAKKLA